MNFNPLSLDASIRDIVSCITEEQKIDVLLFALQKLPIESRLQTVIENAVQSCLRVSTNAIHIAKARTIRAKVRISAGLCSSAQEDLWVALTTNPEGTEAQSLLQDSRLTTPTVLYQWPGDNGERLPTELWREIALFLPRRDLLALLYVSHTPSRVASQLLARRIDLHFTRAAEKDPSEAHLDPASRHEYIRRSANVLARIILDPRFACLVRWLRIFADGRGNHESVSFQSGILANAIPKLVNLKRVSFVASRQCLRLLLGTLQPAWSRIRELNLTFTDRSGNLDLPEFNNLTMISCESAAGGSQDAFLDFISVNNTSVKLHNPWWNFGANFIALRNIRHLDLLGSFGDPQVFSDILSNGEQLEFLSITCYLECAPSSIIRVHHSSLPSLKHFRFSVLYSHVEDRDLFPALTEFVRNRTQLKTLRLVVAESRFLQLVGFDASVWGVLPSLVNLTSLGISYPVDLPPGLAAWLIPRGTRGLYLNFMSLLNEHSDDSFLGQLRSGVPSSLRFVHLANVPKWAPATVMRGFPIARVVRINEGVFTVKRDDNGAPTDFERWPASRVDYYAADWFEWLGCDE